MKEKKTKKGKIIKRILLGIPAALVLFVAGVFTVNKIMLAKELKMMDDAGYYNPVSVGDYSLNVYTTGNPEGKHRLVAIAGGGVMNYGLQLTPVTQRFEDDNQIVVVDRAGYGLSDDHKNAQTVERIVEDYRKALQNAGIEAPYILLPHSIGGVYATYWVSEYPDEIEGIVFFDGSQLTEDFELPDLPTHAADMRDMVLCDLGFYRLAAKNYVFPLTGDRTEEEQKISFALHLRSGVNYANSSENELINENGRFAFAHIKENDVPKIYVCAGSGFADEEDVLNHVEFMNEQRVNNGMKPIPFDKSLIPVTLEQAKDMRDNVIKPYTEKMGNCEMVLLAGDHYIFTQRPDDCADVIEQLLEKIEK